MPARYRDELPPVPLDAFQQETAAVGTHITPDVPEIAEAMDVDHTSPEPQDALHCNTKKDIYGIYHSFLHQFPSFVPRGALEFICDSPSFNVTTPKRDWWAGFATLQPSDDLDLDETPKSETWWEQYKNSLTKLNYFPPFPNPSIYLLMDWFYTESNSKMLAELDRLVKTVLLDKDFELEHLQAFNAARDAQRLDDIKEDAELAKTMFRGKDGWNQTRVEISVLFEGVKNKSESEAPKFKVDSLFY